MMICKSKLFVIMSKAYPFKPHQKSQATYAVH